LESIFKYNNDFENLLKIKNKILDLYKVDETFVLDREINQLESYLILIEKQNNQNEERLKYNKYIFILIIIILLMILVFVFFRLNYNIQRLRLKKIEDDKRLVLMELENKKLALANTNNFISQQSQNLKNLLESPGVNLRSKELRGKIKMLVTSFVINDNFEKLFEEVYPDFYQKLLDINNSLTQNDLKLCACIRLNQTSKEIALRMGVSTRTIESQKYRLKKKLRLDENQKLLSFIISL
jgi:DNA-binding CsgD family transcriptional regulator